MDDCVFCSIVNKALEKELLHEDEKVVVFKDILPKAPVHLLIVSKGTYHFPQSFDRYSRRLGWTYG